MSINPFTPVFLDPEDKHSSQENCAIWENRVVVVIGFATGLLVVGLILLELITIIREIVHDLFWRPDAMHVELEVKKKFSPDFIERIKLLPALDYLMLFRRMALCETEEQEILTQLETKFHLSDDQLQEILMGAHVRLDDNGEMYSHWVDKVQNKTRRLSSHSSDDHQYGVQGPLVRSCSLAELQNPMGEHIRGFNWKNIQAV